MEVQGEVKRLVAVLLEFTAGTPDAITAAHEVAEAQIHLQRVLALKSQITGEIQEALGGLPEPAQPASGSRRGAPLAAALEALSRLERYERRAYSRQKSAFRRFDDVIGHHGET
ncbi:hypothetical protein DK389_16095 [Methylobacterium durans]|uniref:Uncharacterized protein n=1 Tax=Methylobacterium durans TaxID=2202825 RepID=A0A2U8W7Z1_9HYPH|nr:hypothetical protein DK389_16095 [Methylobacterium durans]